MNYKVAKKINKKLIGPNNLTNGLTKWKLSSAFDFSAQIMKNLSFFYTLLSGMVMCMVLKLVPISGTQSVMAHQNSENANANITHRSFKTDFKKPKYLS